MAKRFTATDKWNKEWYQKLSPKLKCLWEYLRDNCDAAGVWEQNFSLASFQIGETITPEDFNDLNGNVERLSDDKWLLVDFIEFQYGELKPDCKPHQAVMRLVVKHGLTQNSKGYSKGIQTLEDKEKEQDKDMDKVKDKDTAEAIVRSSSHRMDDRFNTELQSRVGSIITEWNRFASKYGLKAMPPSNITPARREAIANRLNDPRFDFKKVLECIARSDMLQGKTKGGWKVNLMWFIEKPENYLQIVEGLYENGVVQSFDESAKKFQEMVK